MKLDRVGLEVHLENFEFEVAMTFLQAILKPVELSHMIKMSTAYHPLLSIN